MSRIAGLFRPDGTRPDDTATLQRMLDALPGTRQATISVGACAMGRSTAPQDTIRGETAGSENLLVALDGCIVNAADLRPDFPNTKSGDAALIGALYRKHGFEGALARMAGNFAVALFDPAIRSLQLGRDRLGVKPLYWAKLEGGIVFASQPSSLLAGGVSPAVNRAFVARFAASHYRTFDNRPEESPYAAISQLPAGHYVEFGRGDDSRPCAYWALRDLPEWDESADVLAERYRDALMTAVGRHVAASDRPAFTLSGGLDSSSVLCCAATVTGRKQYAVSSVYADATYDERDEIQDVVAERVEQWLPVELGDDIDLFDTVRRLVSIHDEPVATATWLSHLVVCDRVRGAGFGALFGGLGGDELNAGEYEYFPMLFADLRAAGDDAALETEIAAWARHHDHPIHCKNGAVAIDLMNRLTVPTPRGQCQPDRQRMTRYYAALNPGWYDLAGFDPVMERPFSSYLKNRTYQDLTRETLPCCLRAEDRQCTAAGLDHHDPFLDHELVEFMFRVPARMKIRDGVTKQLLRRAMTGVLPEATRSRIKKTGWNAPAHKWFAGRTMEELRDRIASQTFRERDLYECNAVSALIDEHEAIVDSGAVRENHMMFLWQLINLDTWLDSIDDLTSIDQNRTVAAP